MEEIKIIFVFDDKELPFQCTKKDKMIDICQKYSAEIGESINSLSFYYKENELNLELGLEEIANSYDIADKQIKIFVQKNKNEIIIINEENNILRFEEYRKKCGNKIYKEYNFLNDDLEYEGGYSNNKWNGIGKKYYKNKLDYVGDYLDNKRNGKGEEYNYNGNLIFIGEYLDGKKWNGKGYNCLGNKEYEIKNGKGRIREYNWFNGNLIYDGEYKDGERNGKGKEYNDKGKLIFEG